MSDEDTVRVGEIDREVFPTMRPAINYHNELQNKLAHYVVACSREKVVAGLIDNKNGGNPSAFTAWLNKLLKRPRTAENQDPEPKLYIFGFAGMWLMADEAHIINIAVLEQFRHHGVGELLVIAMIDLAIKMNARYLILEARISNIIAQNLYTKYGFKAIGRRRGYYTDNGEDAIMMSTGEIASDEFKTNLERLRDLHSRKWGVDSYEITR